MTLTVLENNSPEYNNLYESIKDLLIINDNREQDYDIRTSDFLTIIKKNKAIIAGGALLSSIHGKRIKDIDIYVHLRDAQYLVNDLVVSGYKNTTSHSTPVYDRSFMLRNNIVGRLIYNNFTLNSPYIEVMLVNDNTPLEYVVENFDLSFCKIWSDGEKIYSNYMADVKSKSGNIGKDYFKALLEGNNFTIERLEKYKKMGYTVKYPKIDTQNIIFQNHAKKVVSKEKWVIMYILKNLKSFLRSVMKNKNFYISFEIYALSILELESDVKKKWQYLQSIVQTIYQSSFDENFTLPKAMYGLIMFDRQGYKSLYNWLLPEYLKYFEKFNIKIVPKNQAHGYNGESWDFSNPSEYIDIYEKLLNIDAKLLYETFSIIYPTLKITKEAIRAPLSAEERMLQLQEEMRARAERFREGAEIEENINEETGIYRTDGGDDIPARCFSVMDAGEINSNTWENEGNEEGNVFIIVEFDPEQSPEIVCTSKNEIFMTLDDTSRLMYKCDGVRGFRAGDGEIVEDVTTLDGPYDLSLSNIDRNTQYVPFTYGFDNTTAMIGYLSKTDMHKILSIIVNSTSVPAVTVRFEDTITHTVSVQIADDYGASYIGANHCQYGSAISVFKLQDREYSSYREEDNTDGLRTPPPRRRVERPETPPPVRRR